MISNCIIPSDFIQASGLRELVESCPKTRSEALADNVWCECRNWIGTIQPYADYKQYSSYPLETITITKPFTLLTGKSSNALIFSKLNNHISCTIFFRNYFGGSAGSKGCGWEFVENDQVQETLHKSAPEFFDEKVSSSHPFYRDFTLMSSVVIAGAVVTLVCAYKTAQLYKKKVSIPYGQNTERVKNSRRLTRMMIATALAALGTGTALYFTP